MNYVGTLCHASFKYIDTNIANDTVYNIPLALTYFDICTWTTNDDSLITALGHGTHYWNNEILFPSPTPQYAKRTPHTSCKAAL